MKHGQPRRQLHGYVSTEAFDAWHRFALVFGVNVTALLEALAESLEAAIDLPEEDLPPLLRSGVHQARNIAAGRSTRSRGTS